MKLRFRQEESNINDKDRNPKKQDKKSAASRGRKTTSIFKGKGRGFGRKPKVDRSKDNEIPVEDLINNEGTPLSIGDDEFQRPKGPLTSTVPKAYEIPVATSLNGTKKPDESVAHTDTEQKPKTRSRPKNNHHHDSPSEPQFPDEQKPEIQGVKLSDIPKEFPVNFDQRLGIFVDVQNMFYTAKHKYNSKIDYRKLIDSITRGRKVVRAMAYLVQAPEIDQSQFKQILEVLGFELRIKELRVRADGTAKGDWDMGIAIDAISLKEKLDVVALVSGDGDFTDLVYMLRSGGMRVEVYSFPSNTSEDLKKAATYYHPFDKEILMKW